MEVSTLPEEIDVSPSPVAEITQLLWGYRVSQALYVTARLGVYDVVRDAPKLPGEIAQQVGADEGALLRVMRALTTKGILVEDERGRFAATPLGELLRSDHPQSVRDLAIQLLQPAPWAAWGDLYNTVRTGEPAFDRVHGEPLFDYLQRRPDESARFNAAMASNSRNALPAILEAYDFSAFSRLTDVGGGRGTLLRGILERYPSVTGVLCDLPSVVTEAADLRDSPVAARAEFVAANIFESVPPGSDAYMMKFILHDWADAECVRILTNCRRAMGESGTLLVIERVVKPSNRPDPAKWGDLNMLVMLTGRERTEDEFSDLFAQCGFRLTRLIPAGNLSIIEGVPV
jgi:hypothetical protein